MYLRQKAGVVAAARPKTAIAIISLKAVDLGAAVLCPWLLTL